MGDGRSERPCIALDGNLPAPIGLAPSARQDALSVDRDGFDAGGVAFHDDRAAVFESHFDVIGQALHPHYDVAGAPLPPLAQKEERAEERAKGENSDR